MSGDDFARGPTRPSPAPEAPKDCPKRSNVVDEIVRNLDEKEAKKP